VPPAWLMGQWIELARAGRPTANLFNTQPLPPGTDSINIPRVLTGTATAIQPNDNDPVQEVDLTDSSLSIPVRTIAGQQDIAIQLLDQSPINFDELVFRDLIADYATKVEPAGPQRVRRGRSGARSERPDRRHRRHPDRHHRRRPVLGHRERDVSRSTRRGSPRRT
jgi:hypothetical protein